MADVQPLLVLDFGDGERGEFKAHPGANQFLLVRHVDDLFGGSPYEAVKAATALALDQVLDEEKDRIEQFLFAHGRSGNYITAIQDGLQGCWSGDTSLPLEPSSDSSETSSHPNGEQSSKDDLSSLDTPASLTLASAEV